MQLFEFFNGGPVGDRRAQFVDHRRDELTPLSVIFDEQLEFIVADLRLPFDNLFVGHLRTLQFIEQTCVVISNGFQGFLSRTDELLSGPFDMIRHDQRVLFKTVDVIRECGQRVASMLIGTFETDGQGAVRAFNKRRQLLATLTLSRRFDMEIARFEKIDDGLVQWQIGGMVDESTDFLATRRYWTRLDQGVSPLVGQARFTFDDREKLVFRRVDEERHVQTVWPQAGRTRGSMYR